MRPAPNIEYEISVPPAARALALNLVTATDLIRLKAIARLHARGLPPDISWTDLLQEAFARVLEGSRRQPEGLPMVQFLAGIMRSLRSEHWRRARRRARQSPKLLAEVESASGEPLDPAPDPERTLIAVQELEALNRLFTDDAEARNVIAGLGKELSPDEICAHFNLTNRDYDSIRRRIRRVLLREGLRSPQP